jgi:hypothetical protein
MSGRIAFNSVMNIPALERKQMGDTSGSLLMNGQVPVFARTALMSAR